MFDRKLIDGLRPLFSIKKKPGYDPRLFLCVCQTL